MRKRRYEHPDGTTEWIVWLTERQKCRVCGGRGWCGVADTFDVCQRIPSKRPLGKAGWVHGLSDDRQAAPRRPDHHHPPLVLLHEYAMACRVAISPQQIDELAARLGLAASTLLDLQVGWNGVCYTFPMCNSYEQIIGIRTRDGATGEKRAESGSRNGIFVPLRRHDDTVLFADEGPTSAGALHERGVAACGLPAAGVGGDILGVFAWRLGVQSVCIVANYEQWRTSPQGHTYNPGLDGADRIARNVSRICPVKIIFPLEGKDSREWLNKGTLSRSALMDLYRSAPTWSPEWRASYFSPAESLRRMYWTSQT